jgi:hypothetical protein
MRNVGIYSAVICSVVALLLVVSTQTLFPQQRSIVPESILPANSVSSNVPDVSSGFLFAEENDVEYTVLGEVIPETTVSTIISEQPEVQEIQEVVFVTCPIPSKPNRTIVDFTGGGTKAISDLTIVANMEIENSFLKKAGISVAPGVYKISVATHKSYSSGSESFYKEKWFLGLYAEGGVKIFETAKTRDILVNETLVTEVLEESVTVPKAVSGIMARHAAFPDTYSQAVAPLCVSFDFISPISTEATSVPETSEIETITQTTESVIAEVKEVTEVVAEQAVPESVTSTTCPLLPKEGRYIVDFSNKGTKTVSELEIVSNNEQKSLLGPVYAKIPKGVYEVRLSSYTPQAVAEDQRWAVQLFDVNSLVIGETPSTVDVPSWYTGEFSSKVSDAFIVERDALHVFATHTAYPSNDSNSLSPVCASFDVVSTQAPVEKTVPVLVNAPRTDLFSDQPDTSEQTAVQVPSTVKSSTEKSYVSPENRVINQELVVVSSAGLGLLTQDREVTVTSQVIEERKKLVETLHSENGSIFETLQTLSQKEREAVVKNALESESLSEVRYVREDDDVLQPQGDDVERTVEAFRLKEKHKQDILVDTDNDGVTDYDEEHIYKTDPTNPFTSRGVFTDGERILLGFNPTTDDLKTVVAESPKKYGETINALFTVDSISAIEPSSEIVDSAIRIEGTSQPLAFVTLFVYSTPIVVTVQADKDGRFAYTLTETLEDGSHEVYVASVNNSGRILAKSEVVPFVKTAEAIEFTPSVSTSQTTPVHDAMKTIVALSLFLVLLVTLVTIIFLGFLKSKHHEDVASSVTSNANEQ